MSTPYVPVTSLASPPQVAYLVTRRAALVRVVASTTAVLLSACTATGGPGPTVPGATEVVRSSPSGTAAVSLTRSTGPSKGELTLAIGFDFPAKIDALKDSRLLAFGMLECLTRQTPQNKLEPWLAESVSNINPTTWQVTLRQAQFWDGTPVTPGDVIASFRKGWEAYPDNKGLISPDTKLTVVADRTVQFVTPGPLGTFPYAIALSSFGIFKTAADGAASILTGPYKPTRLVADTELDLEPFANHWSGTPPIAKIVVKYVADPNARLLALQSGDVDLLYNFPAEAIKTFGPDIEAPIIASGRVDLINLNVARLPFSDHAVREAMALGIDRNVLNSIGLDGKGTPATALFPPSTGYATVPLQGTDVARAGQILDQAGWMTGSDGVRAKDGKRLAFSLYSYPGRAELTPYAISIQSQLKPLGYDVQVEEVQNVADVTKTAEWDAAMKSNNTIATGDPLFEYNRLLATGGGDNVGNYANPKLDALLAQMRPEIDPAKRQELSKQVQDIVSNDVPMIFLVALPVTTAYRKGKVTRYVPNPSDYYFITTDLSVS